MNDRETHLLPNARIARDQVLAVWMRVSNRYRKGHPVRVKSEAAMVAVGELVAELEREGG